MRALFFTKLILIQLILLSFNSLKTTLADEHDHKVKKNKNDKKISSQLN